ncbi:Broad specificity phosphatase PhoE [Micromonospora peucetia]|uniref:Broad specificity phosphatase PhoE n=1 Tax=Micromonospora peucetia TaxID=47871 RepID=A0A1C6UKY0_9ACTN|nr:Broad specificity phosphatase PhoE [Micromonospora peucetia]
MDEVVLVRHAMPVLQPEIPAVDWELDEQGRAAARAFSGTLPDSAYLVSSTEPKAMQTLQEMASGRTVVPEDGFREVHQPIRWCDNYHDLARAYLDGVVPDGWETHEDLVARFNTAVARHAAAARAQGQTLIIGTHGLAATVWLAQHLPLEPTPTDFWAAIGLPDVIDVDFAGKQARRRQIS